MKKLFWLGFLGLLLFEIANVYLIMPMPGSQQMNSIDIAYFLYKWRWVFRGLFGLMMLAGLFRSTWKRKWVPVLPILLIMAVIYMANFKMAADHMFYKPETVSLVAAAQNKVDNERLVLGVVENGEAKAYPVQYLGFHHQVEDVVGGKPVLITYCTVCRTGRVFEPLVNGKPEKFRLVGMDHFNAMLEDEGTGSWWRQANGEAIAGKLKGQKLPEVFSTQTSLSKWLSLYPHSLIMQADPKYTAMYDSTFKYESGLSRRSLTGTDSLSWNDKSWVVGLKQDGATKAYDWNQLKQERIIHDTIGQVPVLLVLADDDKSFFAYQRPGITYRYTIEQDSIRSGDLVWLLDGKSVGVGAALKRVPAYQEFWHSWRTFNPATRTYR